ncbi:MAG: Omp28-related outer membrane protein [Flavobacteriaceae bacterium]
MKTKFFSLTLFLSLFLIACDSTGTEEDTEQQEQNQITALSLYYAQDFIFSGDQIDLQISDNHGNNVSHKVSLELNGTAITGSSITFDQSGSHSLKASYEGYTETFSIDVYESTFTTKILVEDYTGAWCGYCPRISFKLEEIMETNSNVIVAAIHNGDAMHYEFEAQMRAAYDVSGFPTAKMNRLDKWNEAEAQLLKKMSNNAGLGLSINSTAQEELLSIEVGVGVDVPYQDTKLVVYVLENGIPLDQVSYYNADSNSPAYGLGNPISNYIHNHVLRKSLTDVFGESIDSNELTIEKNYQRTFEYNFSDLGITANTVDQFEIVAFVMTSGDKVINVQKAKLGELKAFD